MKTALFLLLAIATTFHLGLSWEISPHNEDIDIRVGDPVTYTGGVFEFEPYCEWTEEGGEGIIRENARIISQFAADAKEQGVDILVTCEHSVQSLDMPPTEDTELFSLMQIVPDPTAAEVPCTMPTDPPNVEALRTLSCTAMELEMYLVVDLAEASPCSPEAPNPFNNTLDQSRTCPDSGYIYYNTQVVFDRDGMVIARYRKKNLFMEPQFSPGLEPNEEAIFTTDFGVTFSLQVCFDIAYFNPGVSNIEKYGIKDIVMSTAWMDMLPYHPAPAVQNGFSRSLSVNLLVSGYHRPERAKMGSGIYRGASDLVYNYIFDKESGSKLLVSEIDSVASVNVKLYDTQRHKRTTYKKPPVIQMPTKNENQYSKIDERREHTIYYDDLSNYTQMCLVKGDLGVLQHAEVCHNDGLCCKLDYYSTGNLNYSLVAYSGFVAKGFGEYNIYAQVCSLLWCQTDDINTCTHIASGLPESDTLEPFTLSGSFSTNHTYPMMFDRNLMLSDNDLFTIMISEDNLVSMTTNGHMQDLMTAAIYGRWFERDP